MRLFLTAAVLLGCSFPAMSQVPDPPPIVRIEKLEDKTADLEKRVAALERENQQLKSAPKTTNEAVFGKPLPSATVKAPLGHTHTCPNGHVWDHSQDGGSHRCPVCGAVQFVVDSTPKMTNVGGGSNYVQSVPVQPQIVAPYQVTPFTSGGCVNGSCGSASYYSTGRQGIFRRW